MVQPDAARPVPMGQPQDWDRELRPAEAPNLSFQPHIVQVRLEEAPTELEVRPGIKTRVWAHGGTVPGPLIRARAADRVIWWRGRGCASAGAW
jgi:FtsP/CotA-like multicopper oxidase with cupredoxin domain